MGLKIQKTNIKTKKVNGFTLEIFKMIITNF